MRRKQYELSRLKHQLASKRASKVRIVIWKLDEEQLDYITNYLNYEVTPYLYRVQTRRLKAYRTTTSHLLKSLHHHNKEGKKSIVTKLSVADKKLLDEYDIKYQVEKYKIKLF